MASSDESDRTTLLCSPLPPVPVLVSPEVFCSSLLDSFSLVPVVTGPLAMMLGSLLLSARPLDSCPPSSTFASFLWSALSGPSLESAVVLRGAGDSLSDFIGVLIFTGAGPFPSASSEGNELSSNGDFTFCPVDTALNEIILVLH